MPINELSQKRNLFNKIGLGVPQMPPNIRANQTPPPQHPRVPMAPTPPPQTKPTPPTPPPAKPGCGGCRRKRS